MSRKTAFAAAFALALVAPAALAAQTCLGYASFASGPVQLGAGAQFADDANIYGLGAGIGAVNGGFISAEVGMLDADVDGVDASGTSFGIKGGWQLPMGMQTATRALQLCPVAGLTYSTAEADADGISADINGTDIALGLSFGAAFTSSPALSVVPFGTVSFVRSSYDLESDFGDFEGDDNFGMLDLGVGFVANQWITIRPAVAIPFALPDDAEGDEVFSLNFVFNFGGGR